MSPTPSGVSPKIKALLADEEALPRGKGIWRSKKLIPKDGCLENESIVTQFVVPLVSQF